MSTVAPAVSGVARRPRYFFDLVIHLVVREFRLRYRRAVFGWLWAVAQPLARFAILAFVFGRVLRISTNIPNYPAFLFTGIIAWTWFASGVTSSTSSVLSRRDLVFRPGLPRAAIPVVSVLTDAFDYLAALPVLLVFLVISGNGIPLTAVFLPVVLAVQLMLILGIGFALCSANVYFRDVYLLVDVAVLLGFYVTPVFYSPSAIPAPYGPLLRLNPMAGLLEAHRAVLIEGRLPALVPFALLTAVCAAVLVGGYLIFRRNSGSFVDEL